MNPNIPSPRGALPTLHCEIRASKRLGPILSNIVQTCARDLGQPIETTDIQVGNAGTPVITLVLPAEVVIEPHQAWCLACRLACFCPDARVSVLITGAIVPATPEAGADSAASAA